METTQTNSEHEEAVEAFFRQCQKDHPDSFASLCEEYPTLSRSKLRLIRDNEESLEALEEKNGE